MVEVCKYMHWDYYTFKRQPYDFIEAIGSRMQAENMAREYFKNLSEFKAA